MCFGEEYHIYESSGGCEDCDALDGVHQEEPEPPHPNCTCAIYEEDFSDEFDWDYDVDGVSNFDGDLNWEITIIIHCKESGEEFTHDRNFFNFGRDEGYPWDNVADIEEMAEQYAMEDCGIEPDCLFSMCW